MFEDKTTANLKAQVLSEINQAVGISTMAGSYADATAGPLCLVVSGFYQVVRAVPSMLFVDPSSGIFLDLVGGDYFNLTRREGTRARCSVTFTGTPGTAINAGTAFLTNTGLEFILQTGVTIGSDGSAVGELEAAQVGSQYNIGPNTLTRMYVNIPGLSSYANAQAEGGTDTETDQALYERIDEARKRSDTSGNGWDYRQWALEVAGVGEVKVVELANGPGTVGLTIVDSNYKGASEDIVEAVEANVQKYRPVGADVTVEAAADLPVNVTAVVVVSGTTAGEVQTELQKRLAEYCQQLIEQKYQTIYYSAEEDAAYTLYYNRVLALLLTIDGVQNFTTLTVNGGTEDVSIPAGSVPTVGTVSVT